MAGPARKPAERRQRTNKPARLHAPPVTAVAVPPAPKGMLAEQVTAWKDLWRSELAASYLPATDLPGLRRLFVLRDKAERYDRAAGAMGILVEGSTGQPALNPLLKERDSVLAEVRQLEDRYGLSPRARLNLNITLGDAVRSLDEMNRRLAGDADDDLDEDPDPRIVEATATET